MSLPRRLGAIFYDSLLLFALLFFASMIAVPFDITPQHPLYPVYAGYIYLVGFLFFGWFWTHGGQTLGMRAWRFRVVQKNGATITWTQAGLRFVGAAISWAAFGAGFMWCLFNREGLAFHDLVSGTRLTRVD
ncbi:MAG: RDD family protein [Gammaproteobacteria bacterium]